MKLTITFEPNDYCSAHKFAMMFKELTGIKFEEINYGTESKIIFKNIFLSNRVVNGVRSIIKSHDVF